MVDGDTLGPKPEGRDEGRLRQILDAVPDALLLIDGERRVSFVNRMARRLFAEARVGRDIGVAVADRQILGAVDQALATGEKAQAEFTLPGPVSHVFEASIAPLGAGGGAIIAFHDLTEIRRSDQLRTDFVANASHEIRSPLAAIVGMLETLRGPARDDAEARDRFLAVMADEAQRMTQLVEDLLSLSKIEMREHNQPTNYVNLLAVAQGVAATLVHRAEAREMSVEIDAEENLPAVVGDADELALLVRNLVSNSIAYGHKGTAVRITLRHATSRPREMTGGDGPAIALAVSDRSEGIAREHIARLTERFYRVDKGRSRKMGGTGLGLAIAKHVINRHRGALTIESTSGVGSVFTVHLPAA